MQNPADTEPQEYVTNCFGYTYPVVQNSDGFGAMSASGMSAFLAVASLILWVLADKVFHSGVFVSAIFLVSAVVFAALAVMFFMWMLYCIIKDVFS